MTAHQFELALAGTWSGGLADRLHEAGCNDFTVSPNQQIIGTFERDADSRDAAVASACDAVESLGLRVLAVRFG